MITIIITIIITLITTVILILATIVTITIIITGDDIVQAMTRAAQQLLRFFYLLLDWGLIQRAAIDVALRKMKCTKLNVK